MRAYVEYSEKMAYSEQVLRSFSLLVSGLSLSPTKSLQFIVFAVVVMGVTDVFCGCVIGEFTRPSTL